MNGNTEYERINMMLFLQQIASRVLGIPTDLIYTSDSNTRCTPNVVFTAGSMGTDVFGPAVMVGMKQDKFGLSYFFC